MYLSGRKRSTCPRLSQQRQTMAISESFTLIRRLYEEARLVTMQTFVEEREERPTQRTK